MIICYLRYFVDPAKLAEFEQYARLWTGLIEKFGGTHHGFYLPGEAPDQGEFSYADIASVGPDNVATAMFSFPSVAEYEAFRKKAASDPECVAATIFQKETKCFIRYERTFMRRIK